MITYKSKKKPSVFITSDGLVDPKYKTVLVTFDDGRTQSMSSSTLANQWEVVDSSNEEDSDMSIMSSIAVFAESIAHTMGGALKMYDSKPNMLMITYHKMSVMEIWVGRKEFKVRVKSAIVEDGIEYEHHCYNFDATIVLPYNDSGYNALERYITKSIVYSSKKHKKSL